MHQVGTPKAVMNDECGVMSSGGQRSHLQRIAAARIGATFRGRFQAELSDSSLVTHHSSLNCRGANGAKSVGPATDQAKPGRLRHQDARRRLDGLRRV
jgi:hypothetical protein